MPRLSAATGDSGTRSGAKQQQMVSTPARKQMPPRRPPHLRATALAPARQTAALRQRRRLSALQQTSRSGIARRGSMLQAAWSCNPWLLIAIMTPVVIVIKITDDADDDAWLEAAFESLAPRVPPARSAAKGWQGSRRHRPGNAAAAAGDGSVGGGGSAGGASSNARNTAAADMPARADAGHQQSDGSSAQSAESYSSRSESAEGSGNVAGSGASAAMSAAQQQKRQQYSRAQRQATGGSLLQSLPEDAFNIDDLLDPMLTGDARTPVATIPSTQTSTPMNAFNHVSSRAQQQPASANASGSHAAQAGRGGALAGQSAAERQAAIDALLQPEHAADSNDGDYFEPLQRLQFLERVSSLRDARNSISSGQQSPSSSKESAHERNVSHIAGRPSLGGGQPSIVRRSAAKPMASGRAGSKQLFSSHSPGFEPKHHVTALNQRRAAPVFGGANPRHQSSADGKRGVVQQRNQAQQRSHVPERASHEASGMSLDAQEGAWHAKSSAKPQNVSSGRSRDNAHAQQGGALHAGGAAGLHHANRGHAASAAQPKDGDRWHVPFAQRNASQQLSAERAGVRHSHSSSRPPKSGVTKADTPTAHVRGKQSKAQHAAPPASADKATGSAQKRGALHGQDRKTQNEAGGPVVSPWGQDAPST